MINATDGAFGIYRAKDQTMTKPIPIVVCADDYALTPNVSRGIRELLAAGRISATSVMTAAPHWPDEAPALGRVAKNADIGLHVTLTDQCPLGPMPQLAPEGRLPSLKWIYRAGIARRLPLTEIEREINRQFAAFEQHFGHPPAHIDGHHHVHQLPGVRSIVMRLAKAHSTPERPIWVRACNEPMGAILTRGVATTKALLIASLGGSVTRLAQQHGVVTNAGFTGVYDFASEGRSFGALCERFLTSIRANTVMMIHPGYSDKALAALDIMTTPRDDELAFLASDDWPRLLERMGCVIGPLVRAPVAAAMSEST